MKALERGSRVRVVRAEGQASVSVLDRRVCPEGLTHGGMLAGRYSPEHLAVSAGSERVGLAGWIIDQMLSAEADIDEETAKLGIAELVERELASLSAARRLVSDRAGRTALAWARREPQVLNPSAEMENCV